MVDVGLPGWETKCMRETGRRQEAQKGAMVGSPSLCLILQGGFWRIDQGLSRKLLAGLSHFYTSTDGNF